jgi:2-keto-4-pentenoate hydratase/2-oxohepta-3-ene-1,7-dioic acid hydratase in catechol pathway
MGSRKNMTDGEREWVRVEIDGIGAIENDVVAERSA